MAAKASFIMGRSGTGKSELIFSRIHKNEKEGRRSILIVPDRATFETERRLSALFGGGILHTYVLSFTSLARRVFAETGDDRAFLSTQGRQMLIRRTIEENASELTAFSRVAKHRGFAAECDGIILKCKRFDIAPDSLLAVSDALPKQLSEKINDFALIYEKVNESMSLRYIDAEDLVNSLIVRLPHSSICGADVFIDTPDINEQSIRIISIMFDIAASVTMSFHGDTSEACRDRRLFEQDVLCYRRIKKIAEQTGCTMDFVSLDVNHRLKNSALRHLEANLFAFPYKKYDEDCSKTIELHMAGSRVNEVIASAEAIRQAVRNGLRYRDIAVIVSDADGYAGIIKRVFDGFEIPFFMDIKHPVSAHPVSELLLASLRCVEKGFRNVDFIRVIKTELVGVTREEAEQLENYIIKYGLNGSRLTEAFKREETPESIEAARAKAIKPLLNLKQNLSGYANAKQRIHALFEYMDELNLAERLKESCYNLTASGKFELARENAQIYDTVIEMLDQLYVILGEDRLGLSKFVSVVEEGLLSYSVGIIPTTLDQVFVGDIDNSYINDVRFMQLLGMNEGLIPKTKADNAIINDSDLRKLKERGLNVWQSTENMNRNESLRVYSIISKATENLRFSYCTEIEGNSAAQSHLFSRIRAIFPNCKFSNGIISPIHASTEKAAFTMLIKSLRNMIDCGEYDNELNAAYAKFSDNEEFAEKLATMETAFFSKNSVESIGQESAVRLYGQNAAGTATRLETFNQCPFRYFMQFGMGIRERDEYKEKATDRGSFIHAVLDRLMKGIIADRVNWDEVTEKDISDRLHDIFIPMLEEHNNGIYMSTARMRAEFRRLVELICIAGLAIVRQIAAGDFRPMGSEVSFGRKGDLLPALDIKTPTGAHFRVCGIVDRLDEFKKDDNEYIRIVDYKSGSLKFDYTELANGLKLQLPLYAAAMESALEAEKNFAIQKNLKLSGSLKTAGFYYVHVSTPEIVADDVDDKEQLRSELMKSFRMNGLTLENEEVLSAIDGISSGWSGIVSGLRFLKDGKCTGMLANQDEMRKVLDFAKETAAKTLEAIMYGRVEISPSVCKGTSACKYCPYGSICGFDPTAGSRYRRIRSVTADKFYGRKNIRK